MNWILCGVLCGLAGCLIWIGLELWAIKKTLQARFEKVSNVQGIVNHSIPCFHEQKPAPPVPSMLKMAKDWLNSSM